MPNVTDLVGTTSEEEKTCATRLNQIHRKKWIRDTERKFDTNDR